MADLRAQVAANRQGQQDLLALLEQHDTMEKWLENVGYVTERQWGRRFLFNTVPLKLKTFLCHCISEHSRQRPLRG